MQLNGSYYVLIFNKIYTEGDPNGSPSLLIQNFMTLKYFCDNRRHLVCLPYSRENLDIMAADLDIGKHFYHANPVGHYDIPARRIKEIKSNCNVVSMRKIYEIAKGIITDL